jgi:hypothetical protein
MARMRAFMTSTVRPMTGAKKNERIRDKDIPMDTCNLDHPKACSSGAMNWPRE